MRSVGLFEAKTKLSEICERVARSGKGVVVTRRGRPIVRIEPIARNGSSVWEERERYVRELGRLTEELDIPRRDIEVADAALQDS